MRDIQSSIRTTLFKAILPSALLPLIVLTAFLTVPSWLTSLKEGKAQAEQALKRGEILLAAVDRETGLKAQLLAHHLKAHRPLSLEAGDRLLAVHPNQKAELIGAPPSDSIPVTSKDAPLLAKMAIPGRGFVSFNGQIAFAQPLIADFAPYRRVVLFSFLSSEFAAKIAEISGAEVSFFSAENGLKPTTSSWKNAQNDGLLPVLPEIVAQDLASLRAGETFTDVGTYLLPGKSEQRVFHSFLPIVNVEQKTIGYFSVAIPENALLNGISTAIPFWIALAILFTALAFFVADKLLARAISPMTRLISEVDLLAQQVGQKYAQISKRGTEATQDARTVIETLERSAFHLRREIERADQIREMIEEERTRAVFTSKMASLGEMAASLAHEVNNPLSIILGHAEKIEILASKGDTNDFQEVSKIAGLVQRMVTRIGRTTQGLLNFSRNGDTQDIETTPLSQIFKDTLDLCTEKFKMAGIHLKVVSPAELLTVECRPVQIAQILLNLLNNAYDAVTSQELDRRWIQVDLLDLGDSVELAVTDSGSGIPPTIRESLMTPFFTTKPRGKGTGLGLSISKGLAETHKGSLTFDPSSPHTRFVLRLPKTQQQVKQTA